MTLAFACTKADLTPSNPLQYMQQSSTAQSKGFYDSNAFRTYYLKHQNKTSKGLTDSVPAVDSLPVADTIPVGKVPSIKICDTVQYIKFKSFWTLDHGQANVYEIEAYSGGRNVALNKPAEASSTNDRPDLEGGQDDPSYGKVFHINDGNTLSRWSSDRNVDSHNTAEFNGPQDTSDVDWAHITIDLTQKYLIDSVRLYLYASGRNADTTMWTAWKQTFGLYTSKDMIKWDSIGGGVHIIHSSW